MSHINVEIKAKTDRADDIRQFLQLNAADYKGTDLQVDTYFNVPTGRLKLREGKIENNLIFYDRDNVAGPKESNFDLLPVNDSGALKAMLTKAVGVKVVVQKTREIYYIQNIKFHIDTLEGLGSFVEIEASNLNANISGDELRYQCNWYIKAFGIQNADLVAVSYSDMQLALGQERTAPSVK